MRGDGAHHNVSACSGRATLALVIALAFCTRRLGFIDDLVAVNIAESYSMARTLSTVLCNYFSFKYFFFHKLVVFAKMWLSIM